MDEHNEEYRILGLNNDATKDEIQLAYKKYFLKYQHLENKTKEDEEKFSEIEKAYNTLMGYDIKIEKRPPEKESKILKSLKIDQDKWENFWLYNKAKVIIIVLLVAFIGLFVYQIATRDKIDLNLVFIGDFRKVDTSKIAEDIIKSNESVIANPVISSYKRGVDFNASNEPNYDTQQQKILVSLSSGEFDVGVLSEEVYKEFLKKGYLMKLDDFTYNYGIPEDIYVKGTRKNSDGTEESGVYALDLSESPYIKELEIDFKDGAYGCIFINTKLEENAQIALRFLTEYNYK